MSNNEEYLKDVLRRTADSLGMDPLSSPEDIVKKAFELYRIAFQNEIKTKKVEECTWMVMRENRNFFSEHQTREDAKREAERLASVNPNVKFLIWRSVGSVFAETPILTHISHVEKSK